MDDIGEGEEVEQSDAEEFQKACRGTWVLHGPGRVPAIGGVAIAGPISRKVIPEISFTPRGVKLYCHECLRIEPFYLTAINAPGSRRYLDTPKQVFMLSYGCHSCKSAFQSFLIAKDGCKLTIAGRSPIEHIEAPPVIPKTASRFFRSAVLAFQSGQTLAANCLLRVFVEQAAKGEVGFASNHDAEDALEAYKKSLVPEVRETYPSLSSIYRELSNDIHGGTGSVDLFEKARQDIEFHFEGKSLFARMRKR